MAANPSETRSYHINGPAILQATVGTAGAYAVVGVCEDGLDLSFVAHRRDLKPDGAGGPEGASANHYFLNARVIIKCTLVPYAGVYLNRLRAAADADLSGTAGVMPQSGHVYAHNGASSLVGVGFVSNDVDGGWLFPTCLVKQAGDFKASPRESKPQFEFHAGVYFNGNVLASISGRTLYSRT